MKYYGIFVLFQEILWLYMWEIESLKGICKFGSPHGKDSEALAGAIGDDSRKCRL